MISFWGTLSLQSSSVHENVVNLRIFFDNLDLGEVYIAPPPQGPHLFSSLFGVYQCCSLRCSCAHETLLAFIH